MTVAINISDLSITIQLGFLFILTTISYNAIKH